MTDLDIVEIVIYMIIMNVEGSKEVLIKTWNKRTSMNMI